MSKIILKAENISKQYRLGNVGSGTLRDDFKRNWARIRGKEDPFLKVGAVNDRSQKSDQDYVWALRDINFEVKQGEVLGIIGKNGAGKSTLLKILSRVTAPSTGVIKSRGRIASLLEVGTGFNHELTGRENIYLNGAILGMTKAEISSKLDEIIDFSGCERYIDTPTKRYSSGMTVRLAFAVAAFLEPEILVVDEVLAVGDAEFQKKAIGKMQDISQGEGRTVLFVSHNMASVQSLCTGGILLDNGNVISEGSIEDVVQHYLSVDGIDTDTEMCKRISDRERKGSGIIRVKNVEFTSLGELSIPTTGKPLEFHFNLESDNEVSLSDLKFDFRIDTQMGQRLLWFSTRVSPKKSLIKGVHRLTFKLAKFPLNMGFYLVTTHLMYKGEVADWAKNAFQFQVREGFFYSNYLAVAEQQSNVLIDYEVGYD
tara:strand:- start:12989 stop:14269 length:1281 start_codon:yes stop_codon:yes gene_type:complete